MDIESVKKRLRKIYVCSPYRAESADGIDRNTDNARSYCGYIIATMPNVLPVAPHLYLPQFLDDAEPRERNIALAIGKALVAECDELWVFGERVSDGMATEISEAARLRIPIFWFTEDFHERGIPEDITGETEVSE